MIKTKTSVNRKKDPVERGITHDIVGSQSGREGNEGTQSVWAKSPCEAASSEKRPRAVRVLDESSKACMLVLMLPSVHHAGLLSEPLFAEE